ncbi:MULTISPECIES: alkene reductase [Vibrio]|uniref:alkene reductase n=1 Tax=Vibrio TaxID=662 RepID=UPI000BFFCCAE|nr:MULTISPECIES: alkene reductase [unclassified Vibrio]PHJ41904.1 1,2-oxophytodienoate reductase [Vibrio sp. PID17_43]RIZ52956.1 1,2-oxophytodienoate reductase [Vibrio sp. PID23_8]
MNSHLKDDVIERSPDSVAPFLFEPLSLGEITLNNRIVMAPMTRNRANPDGSPSSLMVQHYAERASAGLIIAEGTWPSVTGQAYCRQPGIETDAHIEAWRKVTDAVHQKGGKIVLQIMHAGRIGSRYIKPPKVETVAPSAIQAKGEVYTDAAGMQPFDMPRALSTQEVKSVVEEHRQAAINAKKAGFDGVELHCTSGYLPMQFLCSGTNLRTDEYGGTAENRARFAFECLQAMSDVFGHRVGLRINPGNQFNDTQDQDPIASHNALLKACRSLNLAYVHVMRAPTTSIDAFTLVKAYFSGAVILNDGFNAESANQAIKNELGDAVSFARHFIANPDLVERIEHNQPLAKFDRATLYTVGGEGYIDYPPVTLKTAN